MEVGQGDASAGGTGLDDQGHYSDSPFLEWLNTRLEEWRDGYARISLNLERHHLNRSGVVNGGVLATLLDHAAGLSGLYCTVPGNRRYGVTLSMTTNFVAQSRTGTLFAIGERTRAGRSIFFSTAEVRTEDGTVVANGTCVFRYRGGSELLEGVPRKQH